MNFASVVSTRDAAGRSSLDVSTEDLIEIHETLVDWFLASEDPVSPPGVSNSELLASAAARPAQTIDGQDAYPTLFDKAAALFHSIVNNHAFYNGNKRVALIAAQVFLTDEHYWLDYASDEEMFEFPKSSGA